MLITGHWSATGPTRLNDYHIESAKKTGAAVPHLTRDSNPCAADWIALRAAFDIWKNDALSQPTDYGTWHLNHDPRDQSSNIEIGMLCMANATTQNWGNYPLTFAHAWVMAGIIARVAQLKNIDINGSFGASVEPSVLMNGPIFNVSTHAERALQTQNPGVQNPNLGYFIYSGDPDCRWDLAVLDPSEVRRLSSASSAKEAAIGSAAWLRDKAHEIKSTGITDFWGLNC